MVAFGGWEMPLEFGEGTLAEHMSCRRHAAIFDVSHLGTVRLQGEEAEAGARAGADQQLEQDSAWQSAVHPPAGQDGSVLDDLIVWWVSEQRFDVMPNASNTSRVL